jgi:competence protein ComEA
MVVAVSLVAVIFFAGAAMAADHAGKVDINTADKAQLTTLNGIGDALADRIIEYRKKQAFAKPQDIQNVKGIGPSTFKKNKDRITVGAPEPVKGASPSAPEKPAATKESKPKS